jgi:hypothetical protein
MKNYHLDGQTRVAQKTIVEVKKDAHAAPRPWGRKGSGSPYKYGNGPEASEWSCLINEHNRDIILDLVNKPAVITRQPISLFIQMYVTFAFWTCQYVQQFFI